MSAHAASAPRPDAAARRAALLGLALTVVLAAVLLLWAKWWPYAHKLRAIAASGAYPGSSILDSAGHAGGAPSLPDAWSFLRAYGTAVWQALVAALLVAAAVEALLPAADLARWLGGRGRLGTVVAGLVAMPSMMCTCCTAPVAVALRRRGVPAAGALAYWLGNPLLNPAVIAFLAIVAPWPWVATRLAVGALLVFAGTAWVARLAAPREPAAAPAAPAADPPFSLAGAPARFVRALVRLAVTLVPEYLVVVLALGALRGWLFPLHGAEHWAVAATLVAAVAGTLVVIPTAGEIPIAQGLAAAGAGAGVIGALLVTLPALSLPSMAMVGRAMTWRVTLAMAGVVCAAGVLAGALLWALS